jgi:acyl-CoA synthetase (AMP-forming)/AMP-acid ligase II/carbonic anhydrase/acetyltransferase-like protein (isoleucine patch superfamily)/acyl carrier protein
MLERFYEHVRLTPNAVWLSYYPSPDSVESYSFREIAEMAERSAEQLSLGPEQLCFIITNDPLEQIVTWLAAIVCKAIPGILTPPTPKLNREYYTTGLLTVLSAHQEACILIGQTSKDLFPAEFVTNTRVKLLSTSSKDDGKTALPRFQKYTVPAAQHPFLFQQSSGTTGLRKGMTLEWEAIQEQLRSYGTSIAINNKDIIVSWLPLYHDMGLIAVLCQSIYHALPLVITSPFTWITHPLWLWRATAAHQATLCWLPNFAFSVLSPLAEQAAPFKLDSLRLLVNCSEPVLSRTVDDFRRAYVRHPRMLMALSACYAMAENVFAVTQTPAGSQLLISDHHVGSGYPIEGVQVRIVTENGLAHGTESGAIEIYSKCLFKGYVGIRDAQSPFTEDGWYRTGDRGYWRGSDLVVTGRQDDMIIRAGRNIDPTVIEEATGRTHGVKAGRVAVFGVPNVTEGTEDIVVLAEPVTPNFLTLAELRHHIAETLANTIGLGTQIIQIIPPGKLVKSSSGKISRRACREWFLKRKEREEVPIVENSFGQNLKDEQIGRIGYFGMDSRIGSPVEITTPSALEIGDDVQILRYGRFNISPDFRPYRNRASKYFPGVEPRIGNVYTKRSGRVIIGMGTFIGEQVLFNCSTQIRIGNFVLISHRVSFFDSTHVIEDPRLPIGLQANTPGRPIQIGDHAWIGIGVCIMEGVTIGRHAVVGANSVVVEDVPDFTVVIGNPARIFRRIDSGSRPAAPRGPHRHHRDDPAFTEILESVRGEIGRILGHHVEADAPVLRDGSIDSLRTLNLFLALERRLQREIDAASILAERPETAADLAELLSSKAA